MAKRKYWKIILAVVIAAIGIYCTIALLFIAKYGWSPPRRAREVAGVGWFKFI